ncbi:MAG TPA: DUF1573 domain-containing protein [Flavisolibacter sp.]|nr:DUF1573 domain-containing protein [Flavisolibacter sp.]
MKKLFFLAAAVITGISAMAQQKIDEVAKFNTEKYEFGKIKHNVPVTTSFTITNTSDKPIVIESATAGCGCTTPEYSKEPIPAGGSTKLKVGYNAAAMGRFDKPVTIKFAGVADQKVIMIGGEVVDTATTEATAKKDIPAPSVTAVNANIKTKAKAKPTKKASK